MNEMLTDDDLTRLLGEAASAYPVPEQGPAFVLEERGDGEPGKPWLRRRGALVTAAAAAVALAFVLAQTVGLPGTHLNKQQVASPETAFRGTVGTAPDNHGFAGSGGSLSRGTTGGAQAPAPAPADNSAVLGASRPAAGAAGSGLAFTPGVPSAPQAFGAPPVTSPKTVAGSGSQLSAVDDGGASRVVQTGSLSLVVDNGNVGRTVVRLKQVAKQARGYVSDEQTQEFGDSPSATMTMRVPVGAYGAVVDQIRSKGFGAKVVSEESSGKDVTAQYADTQAQITSLKAARGRFLTILSGARTIGEILTVQQRVDDVQGQIDRLEGARRVLANQSDLATLTVAVGEKADAILKTTEPSGLSKAWSQAKHGFTSGVEALIARSGRALLFLIVLAIGLVVLRVGWRLARRRMI